ncbi:MAG: DUF167 domain-containing protein [Planctomycetes bacterium]|nr:DUF167 domain-containing protein [Planctomycetota bacterium]
MIEPDPVTPGAVLLHLKVVPASSRDVVAGVLGSRLKIKVAAAPEKGRANAAVEALLAETLQIARADIALVKGETSPEKTVRIRGLSVEAVRQRLMV